MSYPNYLIHFNPNHDPKTGQFANGPQLSSRQRQKANKKIYKTVQKIKSANMSNSRAAEEWAAKNTALKDAAKDFAGDLADKPFQGNEYYPYSSVIRFALGEIMRKT